MCIWTVSRNENGMDSKKTNTHPQTKFNQEDITINGLQEK